MSISIYYEARRERPLSEEERRAIDEIVRSYSITTAVTESGEETDGRNWEDFGVYERHKHTGPNVIFEGATGLPMTDEDEFWEAIQHWCRVLTLIRRVLANATWSAHIDDLDITWDDERSAYDPSVDTSGKTGT